MNRSALPTAGRSRLYLLLLLTTLTLAGCRTCPFDSCHTRKVHYHNGAKYRARPIWKMQFPAIGEKYRLQHDGDNKRRKSDHSKTLK
ncbi:MAG: hypothetical protein ACRYG7_31275 [Janthinobacterium lividum]